MVYSTRLEAHTMVNALQSASVRSALEAAIPIARKITTR